MSPDLMRIERDQWRYIVGATYQQKYQSILD